MTKLQELYAAQRKLEEEIAAVTNQEIKKAAKPKRSRDQEISEMTKILNYARRRNKQLLEEHGKMTWKMEQEIAMLKNQLEKKESLIRELERMKGVMIDIEM